MVRSSGATTGPRMPESAGGSLGSSVRRLAALGQEDDALGQAPEQRLEVGGLTHHRIERGDHAVRRPRRDDARLVHAIEGLAFARRDERRRRIGGLRAVAVGRGLGRARERAPAISAPPAAAPMPRSRRRRLVVSVRHGESFRLDRRRVRRSRWRSLTASSARRERREGVGERLALVGGNGVVGRPGVARLERGERRRRPRRAWRRPLPWRRAQRPAPPGGAGRRAWRSRRDWRRCSARSVPA